ncbi:MAG: divergent polysaccharide deacetylase family protein [Thermovirgaceae bacterium]|nr:divergent polysaccharide deacetylase family protein [Thermovirgaceae bacterium]
MARMGARLCKLTLLCVLVMVILRMAACACGEERRPLIAVVVDDLGYSVEMAGQFAKLPIPLTWSIIPYQKHSLDTAEIARSRGIPFMLHLPMEAKGAGADRQSLVRMGMSDEAIRLTVRNALWSLPGVAGLNNHRGSRATESRSVMEPLLREVAAEGLFFIDSRTSGSSVAYPVAMEMGVPATLNRSFLDHVDRDDFMWSQFEKARAIAVKHGGAVVICHARYGMLRFLPKLYEKASGDVEFVTVPEYLEQKRIGGWEE